jgi:hypothetical protein
MAKFSQKMMGKEVGSADVYAPVHTEVKDAPNHRNAPRTPVSINNAYGKAHEADFGATKTSGIKMRGAGAATKGVMSRGPMA